MKFLDHRSKYQLLYFGNRWDDMWRRSQQFAWRLAHADLIEHVVYIEWPLPISSFLKFLIARADRDGMDRWRRVLRNRSWVMPVGENLSVLTASTLFPSLGLAPLFQAMEKVCDHWLLRRLKTHFKLDRPVVWVCHPQLSIRVIQALKPRLLWYDCTEDFSSWPGLPACVGAQIKATDRWLTGHADVVTAVSHILYQEKRQANCHTHRLPNAVDPEPFLHPRENFPIPLELQGVPRPVLAFVGYLGEWAHDWNLLDQVAAMRPEWRFLLIGELRVRRKTREMLQRHPNILCVGQKSYRELPAYLAHSDLCFQFYRQERGNDTRNSQKLFLYFAAGNPVVSTPSADVEGFADEVYLALTASEFVVQVDRALSESDPERRRRRVQTAKENSWEKRVDQILAILKSMNTI